MEYTSLVKPPISKVLKSGRVVLLPGESVGEHVTTDREELVCGLEGKVQLLLPDKVVELSAGQAYYIPPQTTHNVQNVTDVRSSYIYVVALLKKP